MVTSNAASGYVAKINMLRLNIGSGMLRLSSCMLRLSLTSSVQNGREQARHWWGGGSETPWIDEVRLSLSMPAPMLSLSMPILTTTFVFSQRDGIRHTLAQNCGTILMGMGFQPLVEKR